jgi:hypothetical protein
MNKFQYGELVIYQGKLYKVEFYFRKHSRTAMQHWVYDIGLGSYIAEGWLNSPIKSTDLYKALEGNL